MNAATVTNVISREEPFESPVIEEAAVPRPRAPGRPCDARLAYALLAGSLLLTAWLAFALHNSLDEINAELEGPSTSIQR
jgi:hypothetical protein